MKIIEIAELLLNTIVGRAITNQIVKSGTRLEQIIEPFAEPEVIENLFQK